jgi:hypothetical protein
MLRYLKELASFAAFQNHLKAALGVDVASLHWSALSITTESGVNAVGISSANVAMLYLSAEGSVCDKTVPSHAAYALEFLVPDATWSAEWIATTSGVPLAPAFTLASKGGRITGLQTPPLQPDAVLVLKQTPH